MSNDPILTSYEVTQPEGDGGKRLPIDEDVKTAFRTAFDIPSTSDVIPDLEPQVLLGNPTDATSAPSAVTVGGGVRIEDGGIRAGGDEAWRLRDLYFAARTDSPVGGGSGTYLDPYDVSTAALMDARMTELYQSGDAANLYFAAGDYYFNAVRALEVHPVVDGVYKSWYWGREWFLHGEGMGRTRFHFAPGTNQVGDSTGVCYLWRSSRAPNDAGFAPRGCIKNITIDGGVTDANLPGPTGSGAVVCRAAFDLDVGIFTVEGVEFIRLGGRGQEMFPFILGCGLPFAGAPLQQAITVTGCTSSELHHDGGGLGFLIRSQNPGDHQRFLAHNNTFKDAYWTGVRYWNIDHDLERVDSGAANHGCYNYDTGSCHHLSFTRLKCYNGGSTINLAGCITIGNLGVGSDPEVNSWKHVTIEDCYFELRAGAMAACQAMVFSGSGVDGLKIRNNRIKKVTGLPCYGAVFYPTILADTGYYPGNGVPPGYPDPTLSTPNGTIREYWGNTVVDDGTVPLLLPNTSANALIAGVDVSALSTSVAGKAALNLSNVPAGTVGFALLDSAVKDAMQPGLDPTKFKGGWVPSTDTPTIPTAAGHTGEWYQVSAAGTATGNAPGTYALTDCIVSDGTSWLKRLASPTNIPEGSLPITALADFKLVTNLTVTYKGNPEVLTYAVLVSGGTKLLVGWKIDGTQIPDPSEAALELLDAVDATAEAAQAAADAATDALAPLLEPGGIPQINVSGWTIKAGGAWIMDGDDRVYLPLAVLDDTGEKIMFGVALDGTRYPKTEGTSNYNPPDYTVYPQDGGGVAMADEDGETPVITESAAWKGVQPTSEDNIWIGSSGRLGAPRVFRFNVLTKAVQPAKQDLLLHFGVTGQSLAAGGNGGPDILTTTAIYPDDNLMFTAGTGAGLNGTGLNGTTTAALVPMVQTIWSARTYETLIPGFMNRLNRLLTEKMGRRVRLFCSNHAWGGKAYVDIKSGTAPFANGVYEVTKAKALANARGWEYLYAGTILVHGEQDRVIGTSAATYEGYIKELAADESAAYKPITGQTFDHPIFTCGTHSWTAYNFTTPTTTQGQLAAALSSSRVKMMGPKYMLEYSDGIHLINTTYRELGERYAEMVFCEIFGPGSWKPFAPIEITQTSGAVLLKMQTPQGHSIAFDTTLVSNPGNYGFELVGGAIAGTPTISGDIVTIPKTGTPTEVRYAYTGTSGAGAGPTTGARGCVRDSYPAISDYDSAKHLYNHLNTFAMPVPPAA